MEMPLLCPTANKEAFKPLLIVDSTKEKSTRGSIRAAVERAVTKEVTVIVDSLNYIKGFRYELYCLARASATPHLIIYCETEKETILQWNETRDAGKWPTQMYVLAPYASFFGLQDALTVNGGCRTAVLADSDIFLLSAPYEGLRSWRCALRLLTLDKDGMILAT